MIKDRFFHTRHGRLHALEAGSGTPLILLHTLGGSGYQFVDTVPHLTSCRHVLALDIVGHGDSDPLNRYLTLEEHAEAIMDVADALATPKIDVFGQSVGGYIASALAAGFGARVGKVIIGEAPPRGRSDYVSTWQTSEKTWTTVYNTFEQVQARLRGLTPAAHERWNIDRRKAGAKAMMLTYWAVRDFDFAHAMKHIQVPAMLLLGEESMAPQRSTYEAWGTSAAIQVMPGCGHFLSLDSPERLARTIQEFLAD